MKKKGKKPSAIKKQAKINKRMREVESVVVPLCELFAVADDVFTEEGAFSQEHIKKSLGRIYRAWLDTREALDPDFNRALYRQEMKAASSKATFTDLSSLGAKKFDTSARLPKKSQEGSGSTSRQENSGGARRAPSGSKASLKKARRQD